jgi:hypothetical protein
LNTSVDIPRSQHTSSTIWRWCGSSSLSVIPDSPQRVNVRRVPISVSLPLRKAKRRPFIKLSGGFFPVNSRSFGLSENNSNCDGPPAMNR